MPSRFSDHDLALYRRAHGEPDLPLPPKPRKSRRNEESRHQQALIRWWSVRHKEFGLPLCALFSIPNGGFRDPIGASILKREGQRNGVSDLFLMAARHGHHGLFLEMKCEGGRTSPDQDAFMLEARKQGYRTVVAFSFDEAVEVIEGHLK